tara:strand:+ start:845 stop:1732 length:888 start_codon:yes stop_codon:yes gene_type:complete
MQPKLSFNNLNTFATAAQTLSFQDAAEMLHVSPSAVSHQIRNLESLLGYPLFERLDKSIRLTHSGRQLFSDIREPLKQIHQASRMALRGAEDNFLALSVAPVFATRWLLPRLKGFHAQHPEINLSVIATPDLVNFRSDPFDAAIRMGRGRWPNTVSKRLFTKRIVAVCHPDLLEKNGGAFAIEALTEQALIHNSSMRGLWLEWMGSAGVVLSSELSGIEVQGTAQVLEAIGSGDAIGLVDLSFVGNDLDAGRLVLASEHVLSGDDGYFLTYPETTSERTSLLSFEQWGFSEVGSG